MARCNDCAKFVSYDDGNVDNVDVEIDADTGAVTISGQVILPCAECGSDLKSLDVDEEAETAELFGDDDVQAVRDKLDDENDKKVTDDWLKDKIEVTYEVDGDFDKEFHERVQDTDRRGKKIKSARYMKTYKGVTVTGTIKRTVRCSLPENDPVVIEETAEFEHTVEDMASAFEDC